MVASTLSVLVFCILFLRIQESLLYMFGNEEQSRYQDYWFMKGFLEEPAPNPQNLMEYVNYSGYDEISISYSKGSRSGYAKNRFVWFFRGKKGIS